MKKHAFTLIELIVVITILSILGTIAFVSFQGYAKDSRDSVRISDLRVIQKALEFEFTKNDILPPPDNSITLTASGTIIGYQGYAGTGALGRIGISDKVVDPKDNIEYTYATNAGRTKYQLLGFLESNFTLGPILQSYADLANRKALLRGSELGILVDNVTHLPIQDIGVDVDIQNTNLTYGMFVNNSTAKISGTGSSLSGIKNFRIDNTGNCKTLFKNGTSEGQGIYKIIKTDGTVINKYCNPDGLVAEYLFDDISNIGKDSSGNNHDLTSNDSRIIVSETGKIGNSLQSEGYGQLYSQSSNSFSLYNSFSYSFWLKRNGNSNYQWPNPVLNGTDNHKCYGVRNHSFSTTLNFERGFVPPYTGVSGTYHSNGSLSISNNQWYHIVLSYDSNEIKTYENGILRSTHPVQPLNPQEICNKMIIARYVKGNMDNVRIYNRPLSFIEASDLFNEGQIQ